MRRSGLRVCNVRGHREAASHPKQAPCLSGILIHIFATHCIADGCFKMRIGTAAAPAHILLLLSSVLLLMPASQGLDPHKDEWNSSIFAKLVLSQQPFGPSGLG